MNQVITCRSALLGGLLAIATAGQAVAQTCDQAWTSYNEFKRRNVMEESQYPLTTYGAAVRAACGKDALPVPPGSDTPPPPRVRKPVKPPEPPKPAPAKP